jgi:hypothetical protein
MAVVINGISGIILPSGGPSTPIIRGDDPDTGFYFPASGQLALSVNGNDQVVFTSTGTTFAGPINLSQALDFPSGLTSSGNVTLNDQSELRLADSDSSNYVGFKSPATVSTNVVWILPNADGTDNQALVTNASGELGWSTFGDATVSGTQTLTNKTLTDPAIIGTILEDVFTITDGAAFEVDPGNGSIQLITLGANRTPKATNFAAGEAVTLMVDDGSAYTLTWTDATWGTSGVEWTGGAAPDLATTGYTVLQFWKVGTQVYGALVGEVA